MKNPDGHTMYWVYAWDGPEREYNFDTATNRDDAKRISRDMIEDGWHHGYIWFGDDKGAFTHLDPFAKFGGS